MEPKNMFVRFKLKINGTCSQGGNYKATCEVSYQPKAPLFLDVVCLKEEAMKRMPAFAEEVALKIYHEMEGFCQESGGVLGFVKMKVKEADDHGPIDIRIYGKSY